MNFNFHFQSNDEFIQSYNDLSKNDKKRLLRSYIVSSFAELVELFESKPFQSIAKKELLSEIPQKTIDYFQRNVMDQVEFPPPKEIVIQAIRTYLAKQYNKLSMLDIDIYFIVTDGMESNCLDEEGPREMIPDIIIQLMKPRTTIISQILNAFN